MGERREWTKERHGHAKLAAEESEARGYRMVPVSPDEMLTLLAEIERAWGEIERLSASEAHCVREALDVVGRLRTEIEAAQNSSALWKGVAELFEIERNQARAALTSERDSASALYRAASDVCSEDSEKHATIPGLIKWFRDLKSEDDYGMSEDLEAGCKDLESVLARLAAAIDPALTAAALAECQRRDGLDEQVRALTAPVEESALNGWARLSRKVYAGPDEREWDEIPETSRELWRLVVAPFAQQIRARERLIEGIARAVGKGEHETFLDLPAKVAALVSRCAPETAEQAREAVEGDDPGCVCRAPGAMGGPCSWCGGVVEQSPEMATTTGEDPWDVEWSGRLRSRVYWNLERPEQAALAFLRWVCGMAPRTIDLGSKTHVRADTGLTACGLFIEDGVRVAGHRRSYDCPACMAVSS